MQQHLTRIELIDLLREISEEILTYGTQNVTDDEQRIANYESTSKTRDRYLQILVDSLELTESEKYIATFFEKTYNLSRDYDKEVKLILLHEMFLYTIAIYLKCDMYDKAGYMLGKTYFTNDFGPNAGQSFNIFFSILSTNLSNALSTRYGTSALSNIGRFWIEKLNKKACSRQDFIFADIICYNCNFFCNVEDTIQWQALTYECVTNKDTDFATFCVKLQSKEHVEKAIKLFNFDNLESFKQRFSEVEKDFPQGSYLNYGMQNTPLMSRYIKSTNIGTKR